MDEKPEGYGTGFSETEAILAVQDHDEEYASQVIGRMLPGERAVLGRAAERLAWLCRGEM